MMTVERLQAVLASGLPMSEVVADLCLDQPVPVVLTEGDAWLVEWTLASVIDWETAVAVVNQVIYGMGK